MPAPAIAQVWWTREGRVKVTDPDTGKSRSYTTDKFRSGAMFGPETEVHVAYANGPTLVGWVADMVLGNEIRAGYVCPGSNPCTKMHGTAFQTIALWRKPTPQILANHPAARAVAPFCPYGAASALADVITTVFDPRWYADAVRPNRWSALEAAFGLEPRFDTKSRKVRTILTKCWCPPQGPGDSPADFYGRLHRTQLDLGRTPGAATRKVGRHFLRALAAGWLDAISKGRGVSGEPMFDPRRLFDRTSLVAAGLVEA